MTQPALDPLGTASQELSPEAILMRQLLFWAFGVVVGLGLMVLVLWLLFRTLAALVMLGVIVLAVLPCLAYARWLAGRSRAAPWILCVSPARSSRPRSAISSSSISP